MTDILVIDDDPKITALLQRSLNFEGYHVTIAHSGQAGLESALTGKPDLIVLDIMLPDLEGWQVCRLLRQQLETPILMLTARDDVADRVRGLDSGADDYLLKPFALEELLARIRALLRRSPEKPGTANKVSYAGITLDPGTREAFQNGQPLALTQKEFDLLYLFVANPRQVLSREMLMEKIWGFDYSGESNVLDVYIGYLRQKLEAGGRPRLIQTVRGIGYRIKED